MGRAVIEKNLCIDEFFSERVGRRSKLQRNISFVQSLVYAQLNRFSRIYMGELRWLVANVFRLDRGVGF